MKRVRNLCWMLAVVLGIFMSGAVHVPAAWAAGQEGDKVNPEFEYLMLDPLNLPIIDDRGVSQQVSLVVSLEMKFGNLEKVKVYQPKLADAYIQDLYGMLGTGHGLMTGNVLDVKLIKDRLSQVTEKMLGPDMVKDVLLQVVQQRRL